MQSPPGPYTVLDGKRYLYFSGTGYLGLQGRPEVIRAACEATEKYGIGSATSRVGCGETPPLLEVERNAAEMFGCEDAFYFPSGYSGNSVLCLMLDGAQYCGRDCGAGELDLTRSTLRAVVAVLASEGEDSYAESTAERRIARRSLASRTRVGPRRSRGAARPVANRLGFPDKAPLLRG